MNLEFKGKYVLSGRIVCKTGLHIGGSVAGVEIGGVDNPVIKDPLTECPYIPGSALKGKLRSLLEWSAGKNPFSKDGLHFTRDGGKTMPCSCGRCQVCILFGVTPQTGVQEVKDSKGAGRAVQITVKKEDKDVPYYYAGPTRLTVRDAFPTGHKEYIAGQPLPPESTLAKWQEWLGEGIYTEIKTENAIDRVTSEANPRPMERVPAGSEFGFEMILDVYRADDHELFKALFEAMRLLENSALGGSGSRGHGQVEFKGLTLEWRPIEYYRNGQTPQPVPLPGENIEALVKEFNTIQWPSAN